MSETGTNQKILVTSALPYANGPLHAGHLAGAYLPADLYCRYQRMCGRDVVYICGSDEHGVPIMLAARKEGVDPQVIADRYHEKISKSFDAIGMSFDHYGRTSSPVHHDTSQKFFTALAEKGGFELKTQTQLYDPEAKLFLADRFIRGECPKCGFADAYGDQCESCGQALSPDELLKPRSAITDATPEERTTTHWYLPLDKIQPWLESWVESHSEWKPNVLGQIRSWLQAGLAPRSMTRDLPWGVSVPDTVAKAAGVDAEGKVLYVWFDAPIGYISATREWAAAKGQPDLWEDYWKSEDTKLVHFIGKDNIVFHCIMFPAMLNLRGGYVLPDNVPSNEFLNLKGLKFSTSRGVAVWIHEAVEHVPPDYLRYALAKVMPETRDSDFSWEGVQAAVNNELADTLGNFVNRTFTFAAKYFDGRVPALQDPGPLELEALDALEGAPGRIGAHLEAYRFRDAVEEMMGVARMGNKFFNDSAPWSSRKTDMGACGNTIHVALQICASLSALFEPMLPFSCGRLRAMLRLDGVRGSTPGSAGEGVLWSELGRPLLESGHALGEAEILFTKIPDEMIQARIDELVARSEVGAKPVEDSEYTPLSDEIEFQDFTKIDLRVGVVTVAEAVPKSKKLIRTEVDLGMETRQILAGVAEHLSPEDLLGKKVVVVANLAPRKLFGLESQGMLLMAEDREGKLVPVSGDSEAGAVVR